MAPGGTWLRETRRASRVLPPRARTYLARVLRCKSVRFSIAERLPCDMPRRSASSNCVKKRALRSAPYPIRSSFVLASRSICARRSGELLCSRSFHFVAITFLTPCNCGLRTVLDGSSTHGVLLYGETVSELAYVECPGRNLVWYRKSTCLCSLRCKRSCSA